MLRILACTIALTCLTCGALAADRAAPPGQCFLNRDYQDFKASDDHAFTIRVGLHDYYRIGLTESCPLITRPDAVIITKVRGPGLICGPLDWDLRVAESGEERFAQGCIVGSQRRLTSAEVEAIPSKDRP
jgi:hypothetical protein